MVFILFLYCFIDFLHGDINKANIIIHVDQHDSNQVHLAGLIDFGVMVQGPGVLDLAILAIAIFHMNRPHGADLLHIVRLILQGYHAEGIILGQRDLELLYHALPARCSQVIVACSYDALKDPDNSKYILGGVNNSLLTIRHIYSMYSKAEFIKGIMN